MTRYEVTLNGISLESLHPSIYIIDVNYEPPQYSIETYSIVKRQGARISRKYKEKAAVSIRFVVRAYDIVERQSIIQSIIHWAKNGGDLRINDRPGQKLVCVCDQLPGVESVRGWTEELTIAFAAYAIPYWQSLEETVANLTLEDGTQVSSKDLAPLTDLELYVPGNAPYNYVGMKWQSRSADYRDGTLDVINANRNDGMFTNGGGIIVTGWNRIYRAIEYDEEAISRIYEHQGSRQSSSVYRDVDIQYMMSGIDEILVNCGETNALQVRFGSLDSSLSPNQRPFTPRACTVEFRTRGLWE